MLQIIRTRFKQGYRTIPFPSKPPEMPEQFHGRPMIDQAKCRQGCHSCTDALVMKDERFEAAESLKDKQEIKNVDFFT